MARQYNSIGFNELGTGVKIGIVGGWICLIVYILAFLIGFMIGLTEPI